MRTQELATGSVTDIFLMKADGSEPGRLTADPAPESYLAWLLNGSRLSFVWHDPEDPFTGTGHLALLDLDGGARQELGPVYPIHSPPTLSPDGRRLAFGGNGSAGTGIVLLDLATGEARQITSDGGHGAGADIGPLWSPDGARIAYQVSLPNEDTYVVGVDGTGRANLTHDSVTDWPVAWTEDGTGLIFVSFRGTDQKKGSQRLWTMGADGSNPALYSGRAPDLIRRLASPDGQWLAVMKPIDGGPDGLYIARADGSDERLLTDAEALLLGSGWGSLFPATWSPDSLTVAFVAVPGPPPGDLQLADIWVANVSGGAPSRITEGPATDFGPAWQP